VASRYARSDLGGPESEVVNVRIIEREKGRRCVPPAVGEWRQFSTTLGDQSSGSPTLGTWAKARRIQANFFQI